MSTKLKYNYENLIQDPNGYLGALKDEIKGELREEYAATRRQEKADGAIRQFFEDFFARAPELRRYKYIVSGVFGDHQETLMQMNAQQAMAELYRLTQEHIAADRREHPDAAVMRGGPEHGAPFEAATSGPGNPGGSQSLSSVIKRRKLARYERSHGRSA